MTINAVYSLILNLWQFWKFSFDIISKAEKKRVPGWIVITNFRKHCKITLVSFFYLYEVHPSSNQYTRGMHWEHSGLFNILNDYHNSKRFVVRNKTQVIRWLDQVWGREREEPPSGHLQPHSPQSRDQVNFKSRNYKKKITLCGKFSYDYKRHFRIDVAHESTWEMSENCIHFVCCLQRLFSECEWLENDLKNALFFLQYKEQLVKAFIENVLPYFSEGASPHLQPLVDSVYPLHEIVEAHRKMEENKNIGKIVIEMPLKSP